MSENASETTENFANLTNRIWWVLMRYFALFIRYYIMKSYVKFHNITNNVLTNISLGHAECELVEIAWLWVVPLLLSLIPNN